MKAANNSSLRVPLFFTLLFGVIGVLQLVVYWDGFVAWVKICCMSYEEVKLTPFEPVWTSLRAVVGILWLIVSFTWFLNYLRAKGQKAKLGS